MISSKTHEIIEIPRFEDPVEAFTEVCTKGNMEYLEKSDMCLKYIQQIGREWRMNLNYAWFLTCGYLPFNSAVKKACLPTIDYYNYKSYFFDTSVFLCTSPKERDVIFDYDLVDKQLCPNCGDFHEDDEMGLGLLRINMCWLDFPIFARLDDIGKDFGGIMKKASKLNYKHMRLRSTEK